MSNIISQPGNDGSRLAAIGTKITQSLQKTPEVAKEQGRTLAEAAKEIQEILEQLSQTYPTSTASEQIIVVNEAIKQVEEQTSLKEKIISALRAGSIEALKEAVSHPLVNIFMASIEGWQEPKQ